MDIVISVVELVWPEIQKVNFKLFYDRPISCIAISTQNATENRRKISGEISLAESASCQGSCSERPRLVRANFLLVSNLFISQL